MGRTAGDDDDDGPPPAYAAQRGPRRDPRLKDLGISCMLNTEVAALLAVCRESRAARSEAAGAGVVTQVLLLLQSQCDTRAKTKARSLLKLFRSM